MIGLYGDEGEEVQITEKPTDHFIEQMEQVLGEITHRANIEKVAVGSAGPMDEENLRVFPPNLDMDYLDFSEGLEGYGEIILLNDCNAGAVGEYVYGEHSAENLVYIAFGSGIGGGVIEGGRLLRGWKGNFAEVGHMKVGDRFECGCGGKGHWESYCSGDNIPMVAEEVIGRKYDDTKEIFDDYHKGDREVKELLEMVCEHNAIAMSNIIDVYNPELISIGGKVALEHPEIFLEEPKEQISGNINDIPEIRKCDLKRRSTIYGLRAICTGDHELQ